MKQILLLVCITIVFSACTRTISTSPKLNPIYISLEELTECNTTYTVHEDGNVTLPLDDAKCIVNKLNTCLKDREKLRIANSALNAQIFLTNHLGAKYGQ